MSEGILKALMKLFALVSSPSSEAKSRRSIVESFLHQQLNYQIVNEYLNLFDEYFAEQKEKSHEKEIHKHTSVSSVKVLKIALKINEEFTYYQKRFVLIKLIEFLNSGIGISKQEKEFIDTVASTFNIVERETELIYEFITGIGTDSEPESNKVLIVDENPENSYLPCKHIHRSNLKGKISFLNI